MHRYELGHSHKHLLRILRSLDSAIAILAREQINQGVFFSDLAKSMKKSLKITVTLKHIQQLLFVDP
jgi:hypothetical protein